MTQVPNDQYFLHLFGYETDDQPVVRRYGYPGWHRLLEVNDLRVISVSGNNEHLAQLSSSSSYWKHFFKRAIHPFLGLIPAQYSYCFYFLCAPASKV